MQSRVTHAALAEVLKMTQPADAALYGFFRANPDLGRSERATVAETVFGVLRHRYALEDLAGDGATPLPARPLLLAYLHRTLGLSARALEPMLEDGDAQWLSTLAARTRAPPPHVAAELPQWTYDMLGAQGMAPDEILALGRALARAAPLDLRVNPMLTTREAALAQLAAEGLAAAPTPYSPLGIRLAGRPSLNKHPLFTSGAVEIQDEGSQLLAYLVAPKRREMVVDFCAGAGGKTLALGALMQSQGRLYAFDVSAQRLERLTPRLRRSQLSNVHPQRIAHEKDTKIKRLAGKIDRVLVDAPCSGFGTLRRNPDLKWRQSPAGVAELEIKQRAILDAAASLVKSGGRLVYATCSILDAENRDVVEAFLRAHADFSLLSALDVLAQQGIVLDGNDSRGYLQLWPQHHGCDGFFAAVLQRAA